MRRAKEKAVALPLCYNQILMRLTLGDVVSIELEQNWNGALKEGRPADQRLQKTDRGVCVVRALTKMAAVNILVIQPVRRWLF
jgi:hypothetical protein